jgi:hypothetical protein
MPATSGTEARNGPEKRPMKIATGPQCFTNAYALRQSVTARDPTRSIVVVRLSY